MKRQINFRASEQTARAITDLEKIMGETQTGVISMAVDRLYQAMQAEQPAQTERVNRDAITGDIWQAATAEAATWRKVGSPAPGYVTFVVAVADRLGHPEWAMDDNHYIHNVAMAVYATLP